MTHYTPTDIDGIDIGDKLKHIRCGFFTNERGSSDSGGYLIQGQATLNVNVFSADQPQVPDECTLFKDSLENVVAAGQTDCYVLDNNMLAYIRIGGRVQKNLPILDARFIDTTTGSITLTSSQQAQLTNHVRDYGYDKPSNILNNLETGFNALSATHDDPSRLHRFVMIPNYVNGGVPKIECCVDEAALAALKQKHLQNCPVSNPTMQTGLHDHQIHVIKADAIIVKGVAEHVIAVGGVAADAHPLIIIDDENEVACYMAASHHALSANVMAQAIDNMLAMGAVRENIKLLIGPGLGPNSYEFGANAPNYFFKTGELVHGLRPVQNNKGETKYLVHIKKLIAGKLVNALNPEQILDLEIDTLGYDQYDQQDRRRDNVDFQALSAEGLCFFSARRDGLSKDSTQALPNSAAYNEVARNLSGFALGGGRR